MKSLFYFILLLAIYQVAGASTDGCREGQLYDLRKGGELTIHCPNVNNLHYSIYSSYPVTVDLRKGTQQTSIKTCLEEKACYGVISTGFDLHTYDIVIKDHILLSNITLQLNIVGTNDKSQDTAEASISIALLSVLLAALFAITMVCTCKLCKSKCMANTSRLCKVECLNCIHNCLRCSWRECCLGFNEIGDLNGLDDGIQDALLNDDSHNINGDHRDGYNRDGDHRDGAVDIVVNRHE